MSGKPGNWTTAARGKIAKGQAWMKKNPKVQQYMQAKQQQDAEGAEEEAPLDLLASMDRMRVPTFRGGER